MEFREVQKQAEILREKINRHNHLYYVLDQPQISDSLYDSIMRELIQLENFYPEIINAIENKLKEKNKKIFLKLGKMLESKKTNIITHWEKNNTLDC